MTFVQGIYWDNECGSCQVKCFTNREDPMHGDTHTHARRWDPSRLQASRVGPGQEHAGKGGGQVLGKTPPARLSCRTAAERRSLLGRALHVSVKRN